MTGTELQENLENVRLRHLVAIADLPDEALLMSGAVGPHSVRDFLYLLTAWDAELVTGLMKIRKGKKPVRLLEALANRDRYDQIQYGDAHERDLEQVFEDLQRVRVELEEWIAQFSNRELNDSKRYSWLRGKPLQNLIAQTTFEYEAKQIPAVEAFAAAWADSPQISIGSIEVLE